VSATAIVIAWTATVQMLATTERQTKGRISATEIQAIAACQQTAKALLQ
jgi:hypothetical protein